MASRKRKQPPVATHSLSARKPAAPRPERPAQTAPPRRSLGDVVDDVGSLSFISLSKYGALEDEDEVSASLGQHIADRAEQRARRKEEQRRKQQEEDAAMSARHTTTPARQKRPGAARSIGGSKHKRAREEVKEAPDDSPEAQPVEEGKEREEPPQLAAARPQAPARHSPSPPLQSPSSSLPPPPLLSRFEVGATKLVANGDGSYTVRLQAGERLVFHGSVDVRVEYGYVRCNNHVLSPSSPHAPHQLHSPTWLPSALLSIEHFSPPARRRAAATSADDESILLLSPSSSPHCLHSSPDPSASYLPIAVPSFHPLAQQSVASYARQPLAALSVPDAWRSWLEQHLAAAAAPSSFLLCGARNVGKSTLGRLVVNGLLNACRRVLHVELDVGQSEFTPPSMLSLTLLSAPLLSPPHCHLALPASAASSSPSAAAPQTLLSFHSGDVSYTQDPARYVQHAALLWRRVEEERRQRKGELLPVVINTAGWTKGVGGIVLAELVGRIAPQHVLYLGEQQADDIPPLTAASALHVLPRHTATAPAAGAGAGAVLSADKSRTLSLLAYFLQRSAPPVSFLTAASLLASLRPVRVPFSAVSLQLLPPHERLPHALYLRAFNATIVALCMSDAAHPVSARETDAGVRVVTASRSPLPCLGLAIVRAVDLSSRCLYLLTPLPLPLLRQASVLVRGTMELPSVLLYQREQDGRGQPYMPTNAMSAASGGGTAGGGRKGVPRRRLAAG